MRRSPPSHIHAILAFVSLAALSFTGSGAEKVDPTGTWTWSFTNQNGDTVNSSLKLKMDGDKLTGVVTRNENDTAIQDAKLKEDELSFQTVRENNGNKFVAKYNGKISGDSIKGKIETERNGETRTRDWDAKRKPTKSTESLTGNWKYSFTTAGGQTFEPTLKLKQEGEKVTGIVLFGENERSISDGKVANGEFLFKVVRDRDGETFTTKYTGKLQGNALKGKINSNYGGTDRTYDLDAKRVKE